MNAFTTIKINDAPALCGASQPSRASWEAALSAYLIAEARPTTGMTDDELKADGDTTSAALLSLLEMRCPDLQALAEKLAVIERTDAMMMTGILDDVRRDVAHLAGMPEPALPTLEPLEAF